MDYKAFFALRRHVSTRTERGSVLLVALLVLGAVMLGTIYLSLVLLSEIKATRFADNAIVSHYVAESGSEHALWRLKRAKEQNDPTLFTNFEGARLQCAAEDGQSEGGCSNRCSSDVNLYCDVDGDCPGGNTCLLALSGADAERTYAYTTLATSASDFTAYDIPQNSPIYTDIYDPAKEGLTGQSTGITQLNVDWFVASCIGSESSAKLEITYTPVAIDGLTPESSTTIIDVCGCGGASYDASLDLYKCAASTETSVSFSGLNSSKFYRVSFRSLDTPIARLVMTAGDGDDPIPSQVEVSTLATYRESQSAVSFRTLWKDTLSGIFNYVIFSEDSLIKDTKGESSTPYDSLCGFCSGGGTNACSADSDCSGGTTCTVINTLRFCADTVNETDGSSGSISQTDAGSCNAYCNGYTYCGDGARQNANTIPDATGPNGLGSGGPLNDGNEECDAGAANNDVSPLTCRTNCRDPYCGDGVVDSGSYIRQSDGATIGYGEGCDDGNASNADACYSAGHPSECQLTICGDGIVQTPNGSGINEACDDSWNNGNPGFCNTSCTAILPP